MVNVGTDANRNLTKAIAARFADGSPLKYLEQFGSERTFYRWQQWAAGQGIIRKSKNRWSCRPWRVGVYGDSNTANRCKRFGELSC